MNPFPVVDVALEGFRLTRERPGTVLVWGAVLAAVQALTVALLAATGAGAGLAAFTRLGGTPGADPAAAAALLGAAAPGFLMYVALGLLSQTVVYAALLRAVLRPAERRAASLRLGLEELRVLGVTAGLAAIGAGLLFALVSGLGLLILPLAASAGYAVSGVVPLVMALAVAALSYPLVRLSLAPAATMAEGRARLFGAWRLTAGVFWPLMGAAVMAGALAVVVGVLAEVLVTSLWALGSGQTMESAAKSLQPDMSSPAAALSPGSIVAVLSGGVVTAFALVVAAAPAPAAYRVLNGRRAA